MMLKSLPEVCCLAFSADGEGFFFPSVPDQNEEEGCGYLALWILHEDSCWWCLDLQVRK